MPVHGPLGRSPAWVIIQPTARVIAWLIARIMKARELIRLLERDGWRLARTKGGHKVFAHTTKRGIIVVAFHAGVDIPTGTLRSILKQAGLEVQ